MIYINRFFFGIFNQFRKLYLNLIFMTKKFLKLIIKDLIYKPSPHLLSSLIKYQNKKYKIEDFKLENLWNNNNLNNKEYKNLNNFYWFFKPRFKVLKKNNSDCSKKLD